MNPKAPLVAIILLLIPLPAVAEAPVIENAKPAGPPRVVELEEIWRVGGEDDEHIFGVMIDARSDEQGNTYLLDHQLSRVTVVSPDGEYLRELGGEGEGPGECRTPQTLTMMPDGTVGLGQRFPGKIIKVTKEDIPAGNVDVRFDEGEAGGYVMLLTARRGAANLLACVLHQVPGENGQTRDSHLVRLSPEGGFLNSYATHSTVLDFGKPHFVEREMVAPFVVGHTVGQDGRVFFTPERNAYRIAVHEADGTPGHVITRRFENPKRDRKTMDRMNALFEEQDRALPFRITWEVEKVDQTVAELIALPDGGLQVAHSRSGMDLPEGIFTSYDIFDGQGRWLHELQVRCEADAENDGLIFLDDGRVLLVRGLQVARLTASGNGGQVGEEAEAPAMEIICCRVKG